MILKRIIAIVLLLSTTLSTVAFSYDEDIYIDAEDFSSASIGANWEVSCTEGNVAGINSKNNNFELNKYIDNSGVRLSYVIPKEISTGKVAFEFSFYMNGTDKKAVQIKGINEQGTDIFLYMLTQGTKAEIRNEVSGYTNLSSDTMSKGEKFTFKSVIDFDAEKDNISTWINSAESSAKKGFKQAAATVNLKKISFYIPDDNNYTGGGIVIDDFKIYTITQEVTDVINSYNNLAIGDTSAVSENLTLLLADEMNGTIIEWTSSRPDVITSSGIVTRSYFNDETVTLTAQILKNGIKIKKNFQVTVLKSNINAEKLNAGFENVVNIETGYGSWSGNKRPLVWGNPNKVDTPAGVKFTAMIDDEVKHNGNYSLKLGSDTEPARVMVSQTVTGLDADKTYRLSGYVKTAGYTSSALSSPGPVIRAMIPNSSNYYYATSVDATAEWTYVENIFSPRAETVRIECNFPTGYGFAWYDDIRLEEYHPVRSVTLNRQNIVMEPEEKHTLSAQLYPVYRNDVTINWSSSDEDIATVDNDGTVTAVGIKSGRAVISATVTENICFPSTGGRKVVPQIIEGVCIVEVENSIYDTKVALINLDKTSMTLIMGGLGEEITASVKPMSAVNRVVTWRSSDDDIVAVTDGMVIPKSPGEAIVYAEADGIFAECRVTVKADSGAPVLESKTYQPTEDFDSTIKATSYPKLLFDMSEIERIRETAKHPLYEKSYLTMAQAAEKYLGKSYVVHPRTASGGRVLNKRVCELAMVGYINKDMRYINKAVEYMMNSSDEYTATDYKNMNGDIALGDAAHAYAVGYDWLYPFMTEAQRKQIEDEMNDLIDELYKLLNTESSMVIPAVSSNHASVSAGGIGLAAIVLGSRPEAIELAEKITIEYYKTSADPDGFSFEGISYYCYGLLGAATFNAALERYENNDMLNAVPSYKNTLDAITYYTNPDGKSYIAIGDSSDNISPAGGIIYLISKYKNPTALWNFLRLTSDDGNRSYGGGDDYLGSSIPYILIFADTSLVPQKPDDFSNGKKYESGFVSMRDGWEDESSFVTFTSSTVPHRGHNQRDENSFTFNAFGERFLIDPGYTPTETSSHNAVLINGSGQSVPGDKYDIYGSIKNCILYDEIGYIKGDASDTYPAQPDISAISRDVLYRGGSNPYMVVRDSISMHDEINANIQVLFQTDRNNNVILNKNADEIKIIGARNGAVMKITNPFNKNTIMRTGNYEGRSITGGRGNYVVSDYSETIEALTNTRGSTRIINLIMTSQTDSDFPEIETSGTADNGLIKIKFCDGRTDYITLSENDIKSRSIKAEWKNDSDAVYAEVEIGPSVNENEPYGEIYSVKYDGTKLSRVKITEFTLSGEDSKHKLPFGTFNGQKSLFFWQKGNLTPVFDRADFE